VSSLEHIAESTHAPVLASVGFDNTIKKSPLLTDLGGFAPRTEAFRLLQGTTPDRNGYAMFHRVSAN